MKFKVTDDTSDCELVVCMPLSDPLLMPGNLTGVCARCQRAVQHRPHIPPGIPLMCVSCFEELHQPDDTVIVTPKTMQEFEQYRRRN